MTEGGGGRERGGLEGERMEGRGSELWVGGKGYPKWVWVECVPKLCFLFGQFFQVYLR